MMKKNAKHFTVLLAIMAISMTSFAGIKFSNTAPSGQTLWFEIENLSSTYATLVYPGESYAGGYWTGCAEPVGDVVVPATVTWAGNTYPVTAVGSCTFNNCDSITSIVLPSSVTTLNEYAFSQCGMHSINLGGSVDTLPNNTFFYCTSLVNVTGMESVRVIGRAAFTECSSLESVDFLPQEVNTIGASAFMDCTSLVVAVLPDSLTSIGNHAFEYCTALTTVVIPDAVTSIGNYAFRYCSSLTDVVFGNSVSTIGSYAFCMDAALHTVILPASVTSIGATAFMVGYNSHVDTIVIHATTPPTITNTTFYGAFSQAHVYVPCEAVSSYQSANIWSQFAYIDCGIVADVRSSNPLLGQTTGGGVYDTVSDITLTALPAFGSLFYGWSNGVHDNPYTLHLTDDTIVTAMFYTMDSNLVTVIHDTITQYLHDTTVVTEYVHDTTVVTEYIHDTTTVTEYIHDTITLTEYVEVHDTVWLTEYVHDTIYIHDTVVVGVGDVEVTHARIYASNGQIVVDGTNGNAVWLYDINGRVLATRQDGYSPLHFDVPVSGAYLVKIGNHPARKVVVMR